LTWIDLFPAFTRLSTYWRTTMMNFGNEARDVREPTRSPSPAQPTGGSPTASPAPSPTPINAVAQPKVAVLGPTLRFKGELSAEEDFILQGSLEGSISNPQCVTIGTEGSVLGDISARVITVDGKVEGDLHGGESVVVHQTGRVTGNIFAPRVGIVEGAFFSGRIEMAQKPAAQAQARVSIPAQLVPGVPLSPEETEKMISTK
jgi:cytoskeletal protein CcmA (bactofilin family)